MGSGALLFFGGLSVGRLSPSAIDSGSGADVQSTRSSASGSGVGTMAGGGDSSLEKVATRSQGRDYSLVEILEEGDRGSRFEKLMAKLERTDSEEFGTLLKDISKRGFNGVMREERLLIIAAWAKRDPIAAVEYLAKNDRDDAMQFEAMATWASDDPDAAEAWARANHEGNGANDWLVGVIKGLAGTDPMRAGALIAEVAKDPRNRERRQALDSVLPYVMEQGGDFAKSWVEGLGDGSLQSDGAMWMARRMANEDPQAAASWIASLGTKEARREASEQVAERFARKDMAGAQSWVRSLPEDTRTEAAEGVVSVMAQGDPRAAVAWLENLGDNPDYDGAWVDLVERGFKAEPGVALVGALRLSDEGWRERYTGNYLSRWMKEDKAAATEWVTEYTEYLPPKVARRYVPKPPKVKKVQGKKVSFMDLR